ncbi:Protein of unknown function [Granulicella rosea]|uniref:DUF262 domain-containing protein n=2 Tax=Granulicella rosea TaxID=474952 RepID=A0A239E945_9BACT|nr:Protein of unknown function [Granulicella rosea]
MTLKRAFQDFYTVPHYQREYIWGEADTKGQRGDEVEQFLRDVLTEYEMATTQDAPEYFIGTIVVWMNADGIYELIDGQQRMTTSFLTLCAIRDAMLEIGGQLPDELPGQIAAASMDWQGNTTHRERLSLQYDDSQGVLRQYARAESATAPKSGTRSIANIAGAYRTAREFLLAQFHSDTRQILRFYAYLTAKVKLIRIETPNVAKALKIFETVNDRGAGLDAMDLLKNLLFMSASPAQFTALKDRWKQIVDGIYGAGEKPLRFLRYFVFADFDVADLKLQEDGIYEWFLTNAHQTSHQTNPLGFVERLLEASKAYVGFTKNQNPDGTHSRGISNTRILGGSAIRQHYILLLAGRKLSKLNFQQLTEEIENLMFAYLITNTATRDYERSVVEGARQLRKICDSDFLSFRAEYFKDRKAQLSRDFGDALNKMYSWDTRAFRLRYLLAKLTQAIDVRAYGDAGSYGDLMHYYNANNDVEHIYPISPSESARLEFGDASDAAIASKLGNLVLVEQAINRLISNGAYTQKKMLYAQSQFLIVRCQAARPSFGVADQITRAITSIPSFPIWNERAVSERQSFLTSLAREIWGVPANP